MAAAAPGDPAALRARGGYLRRTAPLGRNEGGARRARLHAAARQRLERLHHHRHAAHFLLLRLGVRLLAGDRPALSRLARARRRISRAGVSFEVFRGPVGTGLRSSCRAFPARAARLARHELRRPVPTGPRNTSKETPAREIRRRARASWLSAGRSPARRRTPRRSKRK